MACVLNGTPGICKQEVRGGKERERMRRKEALYMLMWKDLEDTLNFKGKVCRKMGMRPSG